MVTMSYKTLFVLLFVYSVYSKNEDLDGYSLYNVKVQNIEEAQLLNDLSEDLWLDVWSHPIPGRDGLILVPGDLKAMFEDRLQSAGVNYKVDVENIKEKLDLEDQLLSQVSGRSNKSNSSNIYDDIHRYDEVNRLLEDLASRYDNVQVVTGGRSFEGRDIKYLRISTTNFQDTSKPVIMMQSLLHAREWITLPVTLYAIHKLVIDVTEQDLVRDADWIILPIANPDGYEFTHTTTRTWRKNRANNYAFCIGADLNRNFDINWGTASSNSACMDTFHGRGPFSEPETQVIRDILNQHRNRVSLYLDIHSFGSMILYGFGNRNLPSNGLILHLVGIRMAEAIDAVKWATNPNYVVGNIASVLYLASGGASDYAQTLGPILSYTYELPAYRNQNSMLGFLVDPEFIEQAGFETWEGIKEAVRYAIQNR